MYQTSKIQGLVKASCTARSWLAAWAMGTALAATLLPANAQTDVRSRNQLSLDLPATALRNEALSFTLTRSNSAETACAAEVSFDSEGEPTKQWAIFESGKTQVTLSHRFAQAGAQVIKAEGKTRWRGLNSVVACQDLPAVSAAQIGEGVSVAASPSTGLAKTASNLIETASGARALPVQTSRISPPGTFFPPDPVINGRRVAMLIGNAEYTNLTKLQTPLRDIKALERQLINLNFEVRKAENTTKAQLQNAINTFLTLAKDADVALLYFSGHGIEVNDTPHLLPIDASTLNRSDVLNSGWVATGLANDLAAAKPRVGLILLDACRNTPFARSGGGKALSRVPLPEFDLTLRHQVLVSYATENGEVAEDGAAQGISPYAEALSVQLGLARERSITEMMDNLRLQVMTKTNSYQRPQVKSDMHYGTFLVTPTSSATRVVFNDAGLKEAENRAATAERDKKRADAALRDAQAAASAANAKADQAERQRREEEIRRTKDDSETKFWEANVERSDDLSRALQYIAMFPQGKYVAAAKARLQDKGEIGTTNTCLYIGGASGVTWSGGCREGLLQGNGALSQTNSDGTVQKQTGAMNRGFRIGPWQMQVDGTPTNTAGLKSWKLTYDNNQVRRPQQTWEFFNGAAYQGETRTNPDARAQIDFPHGRGRQTLPNNGAVYEGEFIDGKFHGRGRMKLSNGEYDGQWVNGRREGQGTYRFDEGGSYSGGWRDNKRNGSATVVSKDGSLRSVYYIDDVQQAPAFSHDVNVRCSSFLKDEVARIVRRNPGVLSTFFSFRGVLSTRKDYATQLLLTSTGQPPSMSYSDSSKSLAEFQGNGGKLGCVGFREDLGGSREGAACIVQLLGTNYFLADRNTQCSSDGAAYNVWSP